MAQSGYTPLSLYYSTSAGVAPTNTNLVNGELAINITDGKLYYKDNSGVVQVIASKAGNVNVASISFGTTGLTPSTATTGAVTVAGTLVVGNGGTGATTLTSNGVVYGNGTSAVGVTAAGTTGQVLIGNTGAAPSWGTISSTLVSSFSAGTTGLTPSTATTGAVTLGGTLATTNGGTGLTSFSANQIFFASSTSAIGQSSNLTWNGSTLAVTGAITATTDSTFSSTGALTISKGTTAQQPGTPVTGMLRYNTTTNQFEGYSGSSPAWNPVGGASLSNDTSTSSYEYPVFASATSGSATTLYTSNTKYLYKPSTGDLQSSQFIAENGIVVNKQTVATSYTIGAGYSASSAGPITVSGGVTVTVASGSRWVVL
jgi:hypothetical protein